MPIDERVQILAEIADGKLALADFLQLSSNDLSSLARLGASAYLSRKWELAVSVFSALEALDPEDSIHTVHRAHAEVSAGDIEGALATIELYLERDHVRPKDEIACMFLLRASLLAATDRALAESDLRAVEILAPEMLPGGAR